MAWIRKNRYSSPGQRHWVEGLIERTVINELVWGTSFREKAGPALCGEVLIESGSEAVRDGVVHRGYGGLSAKDKINLLQANICTKCKKQYIAARPELAVAAAVLANA